ncbi:hypothetical protein [Hyphomonas oceanitis]|uniref:hypothetical protein n=1 Tax=Hyphomonas oceanitis TaxID=81033 RepID=UPI0030011DEE
MQPVIDSSLNSESKPMPKKQSSQKVSSIASKALQGKPVTKKEVKSLAGSVLGQDEKKGK